MLSAIILAACTGFLSLAFEILWIRLFSLANHSIPQAFAFVLMFYLLGIGIGARIGKYFCAQPINLWRVSAYTLIAASLIDYLTPWLYIKYVDRPLHLYVAGFLIMSTALTKAILFPITHHLGAGSDSYKLGRNLSKVYVANIFGATLGPLFVGIFLLSYFTLQQSFLICASLTLCLGWYALWNKLQIKFILIAACCSALIIAPLAFLDSHSLIRHVLIKGSLDRIVENQYGVVATYRSASGGDYITGGNVYDGRTNLDPIINTNGIHRVIILSALVEKPKHVLMIGLSIGTWLKLMTTFASVEQIDVLEINPGYLDLIRNYPQQKSALNDPRVNLFIDDGRRWLRLHPEKKYDLVVMNTTYHWRAYSTNLLSKEFLQELKQHMMPHAVVGYNPTQSTHVLKTATEVFKHAYLYDKFVIASDDDWRTKLSTNAAIDKLAALRIDDQPLFANNLTAIKNLVMIQPVSLLKMLPILQAFNVTPETITDLNLITEYKYGAKIK